LIGFNIQSDVSVVSMPVVELANKKKEAAGGRSSGDEDSLKPELATDEAEDDQEEDKEDTKTGHQRQAGLYM
jgi:hypothetical protein